MFVLLNEKDFNLHFLLCLMVPAFTLVTIRMRAGHYIKHYENPEKYSSRRRIFIKEKAG